MGASQRSEPLQRQGCPGSDLSAQDGIPTADGVNIEASMPKLHTAHRPDRLGEEAWCYLQCVFPLALENQCRQGRAGIGSSRKIQTQILENIVLFQRLFPLGREKGDNRSRNGRMSRSP